MSFETYWLIALAGIGLTVPVWLWLTRLHKRSAAAE